MVIGIDYTSKLPHLEKKEKKKSGARLEEGTRAEFSGNTATGTEIEVTHQSQPAAGDTSFPLLPAWGRRSDVNRRSTWTALRPQSVANQQLPRRWE